MSYSSLWTINKKYNGKKVKEYKNSWLFNPKIWNILMIKYIPINERRYNFFVNGTDEIKDYLLWVSNDNNNANKLNQKINNSINEIDRILWELSNQSIFNRKDKEFISNCIFEFVKENHIIEENSNDRFKEIAVDIKNLPSNIEYFVLKATSVDDAIESWFWDYKKDKKSSLLTSNAICEFTLIENNKIKDFISLKDFLKNIKLKEISNENICKRRT